ncbi:HGGxSTG domain-containing protein, partial [Acidithiobacillus caldus]
MTKPTTPRPIKDHCMARTRSGGQCQRYPVPGKTRCRLHGGLSTGPK